jgi:hypothetical protein
MPDSPSDFFLQNRREEERAQGLRHHPEDLADQQRVCWSFIVVLSHLVDVFVREDLHKIQYFSRAAFFMRLLFSHVLGSSFVIRQPI